MREIDRVTARGRGRWGSNAYGVELATSSATRSYSTGHRSQTIKSFDVVFDDPAIGRRGFATESERSAFMHEQFSDLTLETLDVPEERERPHPLAAGVGAHLEAVTFVRDYVQLVFGGGTLSLYVWPRVRHARVVLERGSAGYADALIGLIDTQVSAVDEFIDLGLVLDFANGVRLAIPLDGTDLTGPEIAMYSDGGVQWMVWQAQ